MLPNCPSSSRTTTKTFINHHTVKICQSSYSDNLKKIIMSRSVQQYFHDQVRLFHQIIDSCTGRMGRRRGEWTRAIHCWGNLQGSSDGVWLSGCNQVFLHEDEWRWQDCRCNGHASSWCWWLDWRKSKRRSLGGTTFFSLNEWSPDKS